MRPLFLESDGNFWLQSDPRHLTSNLTLKVMIHNCLWLAHARICPKESHETIIFRIGWYLYAPERSPSFDLEFDLEGHDPQLSLARSRWSLCQGIA